MNNYYVYMVLRKEASSNRDAPAGSPVYVGISKNEKRFNLLERNGLKFEGCQIHKLAEDLTKDEAVAMEIELISEFGRIDLGTGILRNLTDGGDGAHNVVISSATKAKMSAAKKGKICTAETRSKISATQKGRPKPPEQVAKMAAARSRMWCVTTPEGRIILVKNMSQFCRDHGLNQGTMSAVARGKHKQHKGYRCLKEDNQ